MENKLKHIIASVLEVDDSIIDENSSYDTIETWDSLRQMSLVVAIEEQFDVEFDEMEIVLFNSYMLLLEALRNKLNT